SAHQVSPTRHVGAHHPPLRRLFCVPPAPAVSHGGSWMTPETALYGRPRGAAAVRRGPRAFAAGLLLLATAPGLAACVFPGQAAAPAAVPAHTSPPAPVPSASRPGPDPRAPDPRAVVLAAPWPLSPADTDAYD